MKNQSDQISCSFFRNSWYTKHSRKKNSKIRLLYVWTSLCVSNWATNWKPTVSCMRKVHTQPLNCQSFHTNPTLISFLICNISCWKIADRQSYRSVHWRKKKKKKFTLFLLPITRKKKVLSTNNCVHAIVLCVISVLDQAMDRIQMKLLRICICISNAALRCAISPGCTQDKHATWRSL